MRLAARVITASLATFAIVAPPAAAQAQPPKPAAGPAVRPAEAHQAARTPDGDVVLVVRMTRPAEVARLVRTARGMRGVAVRQELRGPGAASFAVAPGDVRRVRAALLAQPGVARVTLAVPRYFSDYTPDDPGFGDEQMGYLGQVHAPAAWETAKGSAAVKIAVIDSGVDKTHPDLAGKLGPGSTWNVVTHAFGVRDLVGHGTFVAGVAAAATDNGVGIAGAGFDTSLMAVKVADAEGGVQSDSVAAAITWAADHGADVINISLGFGLPDPAEAAAVDYARSLGVVIVASAGNAGTEEKHFPAGYEGVISVGATTGQSDIPIRTPWSTHGSWVTVGAPGDNIFSTAPLERSDFFREEYDTAAGTSFSSPMVAGLVALLKAANPSATAAQLRHAVVAGAQQAPGLDLGAGEVDFADSLDHLPPVTAPSLTTTGPVSGIVTLTATSSAPKVQFHIDGEPLGAPVATTAGAAESPAWDTFGIANGPHSTKVVDCTATDECSITGDEDELVVDNGAPVFTAPADPATPVAGDVTLTVTSAAPRVQFLRGTTPLGAPVETSTGSATVVTSTYGLANGSTTYSALQCSTGPDCAPTGTDLSLTVDNAAPALTAPAEGAQVGGLTTLTATAPGGSVGFFVGGVRVGLDTAAPYAVPFNWSGAAAGAHTVSVRHCLAGSQACDGPSSSVSVVNTSLTPTVTTPGGRRFSPNGDGVRDVLTFSVNLAESQNASVRIVNSAGTVVFGPRSYGTLPAGAHRKTWTGRRAGAAVPDGAYRIEVTTTKGTGPAARAGFASRSVRVDTVAAALTNVTGTPSTFYPVVDGYRDTFRPQVTASELVKLQLVVIDGAGRTVFVSPKTDLRSGRLSRVWNGRMTGGAAAPAGTYRYRFVATDSAGNSGRTALRRVVLSRKRLANRVAVLEVDGGDEAGTAVSGCAGVLPERSEFEDGMVLVAVPCERSDDFARADYVFDLPPAAVYRSVQVASLGWAPVDEVEVHAVVRNWATGQRDETGTVHVTEEPRFRTHNPISAAGRVKSGTVEVGMLLTDESEFGEDGFNVYDFGAVRLTVVYAVLV
jgi:subtilisin family serine protease/flagellar hook assembly protein FlgD